MKPAPIQDDPIRLPVWQRNYYEHIIRNEDALNRIRQYIIDNPANWERDADNPAWAPDDRGHP